MNVAELDTADAAARASSPRITAITGRLLELRGKPFHWRAGLPAIGEYRHPVLVEIETDAGITGRCLFGYNRGRSGLELVELSLRPFFVGVNPLNTERIWRRMWELHRMHVFEEHTMAVLDAACWDIRAQMAGMPLYQLMGGARDKILAYASTVTFDTVDEYLRECTSYVDQGFRAIKLHAFGDAHRDIALCREVRRAVGDEVVLMLDASGAYTHQEALWAGRQLEQLGYRWYEEPIRDHDLYGYEQLCTALDIEVIGMETSPGAHHTAAEYIHRRATDSARCSWASKAGFTGALRIAHLADAFSMACEVHGASWESLHLGCAVPNNSYFESFVPRGHFPTIFVQGEVPIDRDGYAHVPQGPGLGVDVDWELVQRATIARV